MAPDARELMQQAKRTDPGVVFNHNVPGELCSICKDDVIADDAVVADMCVGHDQVVAADTRRAAALDRAAVHGAKLAKHVRIAHFEPYALARVGQILRIAAHNGKRVYVVVASERGGSFNHGVGFDNASLPEFDLVTNDGERRDSNTA